ncbi:MAG: hypothetical protein IT565_11215 [Rhodospirillales bacterium]|nr:hypothetical protein [Rhodospirillales bacterium]
MGGFAPIAAVASLALQALSSAQAQRQQQAAANQQLAAQQAEAQARVQQLQQAQEIDSQRRQRMLKEQLAAQRARFGASGIDPGGGGSARAILLGMVDDAEEEDQQARKMSGMRVDSINQGLEFARQRNLLADSQAQARNNLGLLQSGLGLATKIGNRLLA